MGGPAKRGRSVRRTPGRRAWGRAESSQTVANEFGDEASRKRRRRGGDSEEETAARAKVKVMRGGRLCEKSERSSAVRSLGDDLSRSGSGMDVDVDAGELCERRVECVGHCRHCTVPTLTSPGTCLGGEGGRCDWCTRPLEAMPEPLQSKRDRPAGRRRTVMHSARSHSYGTKAGGPRAPECQN